MGVHLGECLRMFLNPKMDMRGPRGPRTTSNVYITLTSSCPAKIFYAILNITEYNKIATCLFLCAIYFLCRCQANLLPVKAPFVHPIYGIVCKVQVPQTTSNVYSTLTSSCPAKIFYVILNITQYNKIATCLFLCAIYFLCRCQAIAFMFNRDNCNNFIFYPIDTTTCRVI